MHLDDEQLKAATAGMRLERWTIDVSPVRDWDLEGDGQVLGLKLIPVTTEHRADVATAFGRAFKLELGFDFAPFTTSEWLAQREETRALTFLINGSRFLGTVPVAVGACGLVQVDDLWVLTWTWLHPLLRHGDPDIWGETWTALEQQLGELKIEAPLSPPMRAWVARENLAERVVRISPA